jgi:hypothetical protein
MSGKRFNPEQIMVALHQAWAAPGGRSLEELWISTMKENLSRR